MPHYKLTYFDIDGGRAEALRIAFHIAGIDFEDNRISFEEFGSIRPTLRFNCVPVLEIDGAQITQSHGLAHYIGKLAGLYPTNDLQALYCDEVLGAVEDLNHYIGRTFGLKDDDFKRAREELVEGWLSTFLKGLDQLLKRGGGVFFADNQMTMADLRVFVEAQTLGAGFLDYVPQDIVQQKAPGLFEHQKRIGAGPQVTAYYATRT